MIIPGADSLRWYVAIAERQKERACAELLIGRGVTVFLPMLTKWRRLAKTGPRERYEVCLCPPYVFIGFAPGCENWHSVVSCNLVAKVICDALGSPRAANSRQMGDFIRRASDASVASRQARQSAFKKGDMATVAIGPFAGRKVTLSEVRGKSAVFLASLFGASDVPVSIALDALEAV